MEQKHIEKGTVRLRAIAAGVALLGVAGSANAFSIDSGNPDVEMRLDFTPSVTLGWRTGSRDTSYPGMNTASASEYFADSGKLYTGRLDLFTEFDFKYKKDSGFRISGSLWYDPQFPSHPKLSPAEAAAGASPWGLTSNPQWSPETKRYYESSAEFVDAFAFTRVELGETPLSLKVGRTAVVWGESMIGGVGGINSVGYGQNPNDGRKASSNPNASLKETVLPIGQVNATLGLTDSINLSMYTTAEWRADRVPNSGTYLGFSDAVAGAPNLFCTPLGGGFCVPYVDPVKGRGHDWGIQLKGRPSWFDGTLGVVYRKFDEKAPWYGVWDPADSPSLFSGFFYPGAARSVYGRDTEIYGLTFNTNAWDISWAGEVNYRKNAALVADFSALATVGAGGANTTISPTDGPRGDTWHALASMQWFLGKAAFWDTFVVAAEVGYARLDKVTKNAQYYQAVGSSYAPVACNLPAAFGGSPNRTVAGCADKSSTTVGISLTPTVYQVIPGIDMDIPLYYQTGFGNSPLNGGTSDGSQTISAGLKFTWNTTVGPQVFQINYLAFRNKTDSSNGIGHQVLGPPYDKRDQITLTYKSSF